MGKANPKILFLVTSEIIIYVPHTAWTKGLMLYAFAGTTLPSYISESLDQWFLFLYFSDRLFTDFEKVVIQIYTLAGASCDWVDCQCRLFGPTDKLWPEALSPSWAPLSPLPSRESNLNRNIVEIYTLTLC